LIAAAICRQPVHQRSRGDGVRGWTIPRWGWQFSTSQALDEAYVPFFGAFGTAWDDAMVARWSANPFWHALAGDGCGVGSGGWAEAARQIRRWAPYEAYASKNRGTPWRL
jgi:hypothetical protein